MKTVGILTTSVLAIVAAILWRGYVLSKLWLWFVVLPFGVSPIGMANAIGIVMLVSFLTHQHNEYKDPNKSAKQRVVDAVAIGFAGPALVLFLGFVIRIFQFYS